MLTDDDLKAIEKMMATLLDAYELKRRVELKTEAVAVRMRRYRERRRNASVTNVTESVTKPRAKRNASGNRGVTHEAPTNAAWNAYAEAYLKRWGAEPMRNRTVNGQLAQFVARIPAAEAPAVAAFFVQSNRGLYVSAKHPINLLLRNAEALRTEWATGRAGTHTEAMQADRTAATGNVFRELIEENRNARK